MKSIHLPPRRVSWDELKSTAKNYKMTVKTKKKTKNTKLNPKKLDKIANILCPSYDDYSDELSLLNPRKFK